MPIQHRRCLSCHLRQEVKSYTFGTHPRRLQTQAESSDRLQTVAAVELGCLYLRMDLRELDPLGKPFDALRTDQLVETSGI